jgi:hypothetical protein
MNVDLMIHCSGDPVTRILHVSYTCPSYPSDSVRKKLTITIDEQVYRGLYRHVGPGRISKFIEHLVRPHVLPEDLDEAYAHMARDEERESEALEWAEELIGDVADDPG